MKEIQKMVSNVLCIIFCGMFSALRIEELTHPHFEMNWSHLTGSCIGNLIDRNINLPILQSKVNGILGN